MLSAVFSSSSTLLPLFFLADAFPSSWSSASSLGHCYCLVLVFISSQFVFCWIRIHVTLLTVLVLFLIHEYGVTHMKCVDGFLSFSGELCDICTAVSLWCITNTNSERSKKGIRLEKELLPAIIGVLFLTDSLIISQNCHLLTSFTTFSLSQLYQLA